MTSIETALQSILAADYGLNEGDHLKLCDLLKKTFDESKKIGKVVKSRETKIVDVGIEFIYADSCKYKIVNETTISYEQGGPSVPYIPCAYTTHVTCQDKDGSIQFLTFPWDVANVIAKILRTRQEMGWIKISRYGIESTVKYDQFIKQCVRNDVLEQKARKKFGDLPDGMEEHDGAFWRGDYGYMRFIQHVSNILT